MNAINYKVYGEGYPVIILHGLLGMLDNWQSFAKNLSKDYKVITIDQRNHGKSFHSNEFDYKLLAEDLNTFLDDQNIEACHLIGHSMGGKTVMQFLMDYPERVASSVVVDISPKSFGGGHEDIFKALLSLDINNLETRSDAQDHMKAHLGDTMGVIFFLLKNLGRKPTGGFKWKANISSLWENYDNIKAGISGNEKVEKNILFIKGGRSGYIQKDDEADIKSIFPLAQIKTIPDAGHWVHADTPDELLNEISNFFDS